MDKRIVRKGDKAIFEKISKRSQLEKPEKKDDFELIRKDRKVNSKRNS